MPLYEDRRRDSGFWIDASQVRARAEELKRSLSQVAFVLQHRPQDIKWQVLQHAQASFATQNCIDVVPGLQG